MELTAHALSQDPSLGAMMRLVELWDFDLIVRLESIMLLARLILAKQQFKRFLL